MKRRINLYDPTKKTKVENMKMPTKTRLRNTAFQPPQSVRRDVTRTLTSADPGLIVPLAYIPLLREDSLRSGSYTVSVQMEETAETLMNGVELDVQAHFVSYLCFDRFNKDPAQLNRSYAGEPAIPGGSVVPFIEKNTIGGNKIYQTMGIHGNGTNFVNRSIQEAYWEVVNMRRTNRSAHLTPFDVTTTTLAPAFWPDSRMRYIVPNFDDVMIDGAVPLTVTEGAMPVKGIGFTEFQEPTILADQSLKETQGGTYRQVPYASASGEGERNPTIQTGASGWPAIYAELEENGITVSLSNIDLAKKTAAFAKIRQQMSGVSDDYIIDLLLQGIRVPEEQMAQPILLARQKAMLGFVSRHSTDQDALDVSITQGRAQVGFNIRVPKQMFGGVVIITAQVVPERLFERQKDYFHDALDVADFPDFVRDSLDTQPVSLVKNDHVDVKHSQPDGLFGYAPLNHEWMRDLPRVGGKFRRQDPDVFNEHRQRIWFTETTDPTLTEDFYVVNELTKGVFATSVGDGLEFLVRGSADIVGNTYFGPELLESVDDYEQVMTKADLTRHEGDGTDVPT